MRFTKFYNHYSAEIEFLLDFIDTVSKDSQVLDYGCGDGRLLKLLIQKVHVTGVDINESLVDINLKNGLNCLKVSEFEKTKKKFDVIILSHVIEHLDYNKLYIFINNILKRLHVNGKLVIFSPLMNLDFYDDFDHVKPYYPLGFEAVFCHNNDPFQFIGTPVLKRLYIDYRYSKRHVKFFIPRNIFEQKIVEFLDMIFLYTYFISPRLFGIPTGWMGLYEKVSNEVDIQ